MAHGLLCDYCGAAAAVEDPFVNDYALPPGWVAMNVRRAGEPESGRRRAHLCGQGCAVRHVARALADLVPAPVPDPATPEEGLPNVEPMVMAQVLGRSIAAEKGRL